MQNKKKNVNFQLALSQFAKTLSDTLPIYQILTDT